jgi:hypothetical protein
MLPVSLVLLLPPVAEPLPLVVESLVPPLPLPLPHEPSKEALSAQAARANWNFTVRIKRRRIGGKLWLGIRLLIN